MFKFTTITALLFALIGLTGCQKEELTAESSIKTEQSTQQTSTVYDTKPNVNPDWTTYVALTDPTYPPFEFKKEDGTVGGMEIEIFNAIANNQGFNVTYAPHGWDGIFETLKQPDVVFIVSAVGMTDEAKAGALLSNPYYVSPYRLLVLDQTKLEDWEKLPKIAVSESEDGFEDLPIKFGVKPEQMVKYPSVFTAVGGLVKGEVDAVVADSTVLQYNMISESMKEYKDKFISEALPASDGSNLVFAIDKANPELLEKVNKGLENIKASGELEQILTKYGQTAPTATATK